MKGADINRYHDDYVLIFIIYFFVLCLCNNLQLGGTALYWACQKKRIDNAILLIIFGGNMSEHCYYYEPKVNCWDALYKGTPNPHDVNYIKVKYVYHTFHEVCLVLDLFTQKTVEFYDMGAGKYMRKQYMIKNVSIHVFVLKLKLK